MIHRNVSSDIKNYRDFVSFSERYEIDYIIYKDNLKDKINELRNKINTIMNNDDVNKYYLDVGLLLHSYYENIENSKNNEHDYEKFDFLPKSEMYNNERCISSFVSADFYKVIFEKVQNTCGVDDFAC